MDREFGKVEKRWKERIMGSELLKRNLLIWVGLFILAFTNGAIREVGIKRVIEEPWAHHLSALTSILIFGGYAWILWNKTRITSIQEAAWVGAIWFALTLFTETFVLNRLMSKLSWDQILQSYNLARGELWPLVLIWIGALPVLIFKIRGTTE